MTGSTGATGSTGSTGATGPTGPSYTIASASMTTNATLNANAYTNMPGVTITFTPTTNSAQIFFTAAGFGYTGSNSIVEFNVLVNGVAIGGAMEKVGTYNSWDGYSVTTWSVGFNKSAVVNANVANTVVVQYRTAAISGTRGITINGANNDATHATVSAFYK